MENKTPNDQKKKGFSFQDEFDEWLNRPTFISEMKKANAKRSVTDEMSFSHDLRDNWAIYLFLLVSAVFSAMLGWYLGTAPERLPDGSLYFHTDPGHLFTAIMYMVSFVGITEFAFGLAKRKYYTREHKNEIQGGTMLAMMVIAGISILFTGISGGIVVASTISFLTDFVSVPDWAQYWVVRVIPSLFLLYSVLLTVYALASHKAEANRMLAGRQHERELDSRARKEALEQMLQEQLEMAESEHYVQLVKSGMMTKAQAEAAMRANKTLAPSSMAKQREEIPEVQERRPVRPQIPQLQYQANAKPVTGFSDNGHDADTDPNSRGRQ